MGFVWKFQSPHGSLRFPRVGRPREYNPRVDLIGHLEHHATGFSRPDLPPFHGETRPTSTGRGAIPRLLPSLELSVLLARCDERPPPPPPRTADLLPHLHRPLLHSCCFHISTPLPSWPPLLPRRRHLRLRLRGHRHLTSKLWLSIYLYARFLQPPFPSPFPLPSPFLFFLGCAYFLE